MYVNLQKEHKHGMLNLIALCVNVLLKYNRNNPSLD